MSTATGRLNWPFAAVWAVCTSIGWLVAVAVAEPASGSVVYLWAVFFAQFVTLALRWPLIDRQSRAVTQTEDEPLDRWWKLAAHHDHELTWILCWISLLHVLGAVLVGYGLAGALVLSLMLAGSEILLLRFAPPEWHGGLSRWLPEHLCPRYSQLSALAADRLWQSDDRAYPTRTTHRISFRRTKSTKSLSLNPEKSALHFTARQKTVSHTSKVGSAMKWHRDKRVSV